MTNTRREMPAPSDLITVQPRQSNIDDRDVGARGFQQLQARESFLRFEHLVAGKLEHHPKHLAGVAIILDNQHPSREIIAG